MILTLIALVTSGAALHAHRRVYRLQDDLQTLRRDLLQLGSTVDRASADAAAIGSQEIARDKLVDARLDGLARDVRSVARRVDTILSEGAHDPRLKLMSYDQRVEMHATYLKTMSRDGLEAMHEELLAAVRREGSEETPGAGGSV